MATEVTSVEKKSWADIQDEEDEKETKELNEITEGLAETRPVAGDSLAFIIPPFIPSTPFFLSFTLLLQNPGLL
jgi:VIT1/CCC1 family predicted Fe2+/Mn2+ transporter